MLSETNLYKKTLTWRVFLIDVKIFYFPLRNGRPVFVFSTTDLPAGKSHALDLASLQSNR